MIMNEKLYLFNYQMFVLQIKKGWVDIFQDK